MRCFLIERNPQSQNRLSSIMCSIGLSSRRSNKLRRLMVASAVGEVFKLLGMIVCVLNDYIVAS